MKILKTSRSPSPSWRRPRHRQVKCQNRARGRSGFTLVELLVVLAIAAMLAGIVGLQFRGYLNRAAQARLFDRLSEADRQARVEASSRKTLRTTLRVDTDVVSLRSTRLDNASYGRTFDIPSGLEVELLSSPDIPSQEVPFFRFGQSPLYVIEVRDEQPLFWFVALGASGQTLRLDNRRDVDALLQLSRSKRVGG